MSHLYAIYLHQKAVRIPPPQPQALPPAQSARMDQHMHAYVAACEQKKKRTQTKNARADDWPDTPQRALAYYLIAIFSHPGLIVVL